MKKLPVTFWVLRQAALSAKVEIDAPIFAHDPKSLRLTFFTENFVARNPVEVSIVIRAPLFLRLTQIFVVD